MGRAPCSTRGGIVFMAKAIQGAGEMKLLDVQHEFFQPLWRRVAVVLVCFGWTGFEFIWGDPFWGVIMGGIGAWCAHQFFYAFEPGREAAKPPVDD